MDCLHDENEILELIPDEEKRKKVGLVRVQVAEILQLGLTVKSTPIEAIRGHVSIPELDVAAMNASDKREVNERMDKLAELASHENCILRDPKDEPDGK